MDSAELALLPGQVVEVIPSAVGRVVRRGEEAITVDVAPRPAASWLREQQDPRWREHADARWWNVLPLTGGAILVPEPLLRLIRAATRDDVMNAVNHGNEHARRTIAQLFPDIVADIIRGRQG